MRILWKQEPTECHSGYAAIRQHKLQKAVTTDIL